jgi:hypothetical protein
MEFELMDLKAHKRVWTNADSQSEPVAGKRISDVVPALDRNLAQGLTEVTDSLNAYFSAKLAARL